MRPGRRRPALSELLLLYWKMTRGEYAPNCGFHPEGPGLDDKNGKARIRLLVNKYGSGLILINDNGKILSRLGAGEGSSNLRLYDENGKVRIYLKVGKFGPWLILCNENGENVLGGTIVGLDVFPAWCFGSVASRGGDKYMLPGPVATCLRPCLRQALFDSPVTS